MDLSRAVDYGAGIADYVEIRREQNFFEKIVMKNGAVETIERSRSSGIGVRVILRGCGGYSSTDDERRWKECIERAAKSAKSAQSQTLRGEPVAERASIKNKKEIDGLELLERASQIDCQDKINIQGVYGSLSSKRHVVTSEGSDVEQDLFVALLGVNVFREGARGTDSFGGTVGEEMFRREKSPEAIGKRALERAVEAEGGRQYTGKVDVVMDSHLAGAIAHESVGHMCEADSVRSGYSPLTKESVGTRIASPEVTITDEGVVDCADYPGFTIWYDDENVKTRNTTIIEKGVLKGFFYTRDTAASFDAETTGNARALDYTYPPIERMRNTYITPGTVSVEEALEALGDGLYLLGSRGGQASPDGTFMVHVDRGYVVKGGKIESPVKNIAIKGNVWSFLKNVELCCRDFKMYLMGPLGGCGKNMQEGLTVGFGGSHILVRGMMV